MTNNHIGILVGTLVGDVYALMSVGASFEPDALIRRGGIVAVLGIALIILLDDRYHSGPERHLVERRYKGAIAGTLFAWLIGSLMLASVLGQEIAKLPWIGLVLIVHFLAFTALWNGPVREVVTGLAVGAFLIGTGIVLTNSSPVALGLAIALAPGLILLLGNVLEAWTGARRRRRPKHASGTRPLDDSYTADTFMSWQTQEIPTRERIDSTPVR